MGALIGEPQVSRGQQQSFVDHCVHARPGMGTGPVWGRARYRDGPGIGTAAAGPGSRLVNALINGILVSLEQYQFTVDHANAG